MTRIGRTFTRVAPSGSPARRTALLAPVALLVALGAAGCGLLPGGGPDPTTPGPDASPTGSATATPTATATASATPSASRTLGFAFETDGVGAYRINRTLTQLQATPGLDQVTPNADCPGNMVARGTGPLSEVRLHFRPDGRLYLVENRDPELPTPSGVLLGTNLDSPNAITARGLKEVYSGAGLETQELTRGGEKAFWVKPPGSYAILFVLNGNSDVDVMYAGDSSFLRSSFTASGKFC